MRLTLVFLLAFFLSLRRDSCLFSCGSRKKGIYKGLDFTKTITPLALMASESIAHEAEDRMGYWHRPHEGERNNCYNPTSWSKISRQNSFSKENAIQPPLFEFSKPGLFATSGL